MKNCTQLSREEREEIEGLLKSGSTVEEITKRTGRHRSTVYREIKRNRNMLGHYVGSRAHELSQERRKRAKKRKIEKYKELYHHIDVRLERGWSPEQIVARMRQEGFAYYVCAETIYQFIYRHPSGVVYQRWRKQLPYKRRVRVKRWSRQSKTTRLLRRQCHISQRPAAVDARESLGHWEGDTIRFSTSRKSNVTTLVERVSRFCLLIKNENATSKTVVNGMLEMMKMSRPKSSLFQTMTFDQGAEFQRFHPLLKHLKGGVYFCDASSPEQRGTNENTNGRLRRDLPRNINIDVITQEELNAIADKHNNKPRKCLAWLTPKEAYRKAHPTKAIPQVGPHKLSKRVF